MDTLNIVAWLVIGAIAGLIAAIVTERRTTVGYVTDVLIGLVGGFVGGLVLYALNITAGGRLGGLNILGAVIALVGAIIFLGLLEFFRQSPR